MSNNEPRNSAFDQASKSLPAFIFGGCIGGLLLGVIFGNIPYGVAAGVVLAPALWIMRARKRNGSKNTGPASDADA